MGVAEYIYLLIPMLMSSQGYGNILRLPCKKFADFRAIQKNHALEDGWVIRTIENTNLHDCRFECLRNRKCKSFNFRNDGSACELNSQSAEDQQDDVITVPRAGWTYHSTIYNDVLVGQNCRRKNPCPGKRCIDTCGYPGYQCSGTMVINIPNESLTTTAKPTAPMTTAKTTAATTNAPMTTQITTEIKETVATTQAPATTNAPMTTQVATEMKETVATTQAPATTNAPMTTQVAIETKETAATTQAPATTNSPITTQAPVATQEPKTEPTVTATTNVHMTTEAPTATTQKPTDPVTATFPITSTFDDPCQFGYCAEQPNAYCRPSEEDKNKAEFYLPAIDDLDDIIIENCGTKCTDLCSRVTDPHCGTDGRTYVNLCLLNYTKCKREGKLGLYHRGKCFPKFMSQFIRPPRPG